MSIHSEYVQIRCLGCDDSRFEEVNEVDMADAVRLMKDFKDQHRSNCEGMRVMFTFDVTYDEDWTVPWVG